MKKNISLIILLLIFALIVTGICIIVNKGESTPGTSEAGQGGAPASPGNTADTRTTASDTGASAASEHVGTMTPVTETEHVPEAPIVGKEYDLYGYTIVRDENGKDWITDYHGTDTEIWFTPDFGLLKPSAIGPGAFAGTKITVFRFSGDLTEIGERAFENCTELKEFTANTFEEENLTRIGYRAFAGTTSLSQFNIWDKDTISKNVIFIEAETFYGSGIEMIKLEGVYQIKERAFANCENLRELWIPANTMLFAESMLDGSQNVIVHCPNYSKAMEWCKEHSVMAMDSGKTRGDK